MGAMLGGGAPGASYVGSYVFERPHIQQHRLNASMPVHRDGNDTYSVSTTASLLSIESPVTLTNGVVLPTDFYRFELGGSFFRRLENRRNFGVRLSGGSASDRPFGSFDELTFTLSTTYSFPEGENGTWTVFVFMANNTSFANYIPIPGGMYTYRKDNFIGMFGLPFAALSWSPELWQFSFSFFGPFVSSEVGYGTRDAFQAYLGFNWAQLSHLRYSRQDDRFRVFLDEKKVFVGGRFPLLNWLSTDVQLGHAFSRSLSERRNIFRTDGGEAKLPAAWYVQANLALRAY